MRYLNRGLTYRSVMCDSAIMQTFADVIKAFGGPTRFSRALDLPISTALSMKARSRIQPAYWQRIVEAAETNDIPGVTLDVLERLASELPPKPLRQKDQRRATRIA